MKAVKLKLGTHMDSGLLYRINQYQGQGPIIFGVIGITSLDRFYKFLLMKNCCRIFLKNCKATMLKPGTYMENGLMYRIYRNQGQGPITHGVKYLDRFNVSMLLFPAVIYLVSMN